MCAIVGSICIGARVLTLVALKLGASEIYLGILSFAIFGTWACRMFTMSAVEKSGKRKVMIFWKMISVMFIVPLLFFPLLANYWSPNAALALILIATFARVGTYSLGNTGWFPILHDIVPRRITGRYFANMRTSWQTAGLITSLLIAWFLWKNSDWWRFEAIFIVGLIAFTARAAAIIPMVENPTITTKPKMGIPARFYEAMRQKKLRRLAPYILAYLIAAKTDKKRHMKYKKPMYKMLDRILEVGRNENGLFYMYINPITGEINLTHGHPFNEPCPVCQLPPPPAPSLAPNIFDKGIVALLAVAALMPRGKKR